MLPTAATVERSSALRVVSDGVLPQPTVLPASGAGDTPSPPVDSVEKALTASAKRVLAPRVLWIDDELEISFVEFARCADALRGTRRQRPDSPRPSGRDLARILGRFASFVACDVAALEPVVLQVLSRLEAAGTRWRSLTEDNLFIEPHLDRFTVRRHLIEQLGLTLTQTRRAVAMRRVVLELAATDEQIAQIAYLVGHCLARS
jgi:AraC-like DNA-binding protein